MKNNTSVSLGKKFTIQTVVDRGVQKLIVLGAFKTRNRNSKKA
jgi:hypothetical protein